MCSRPHVPFLLLLLLVLLPVLLLLLLFRVFKAAKVEKADAGSYHTHEMMFHVRVGPMTSDRNGGRKR